MNTYQQQKAELEARKCPMCDGEGHDIFKPRMPTETPCPDCNGTGVKVDAFDKWWESAAPFNNGHVGSGHACAEVFDLAKTAFNAGRDSKND